MSLEAVLSLAKDDVDKAVTGLEQWYDGTMDRVSGWYKRESQHIMFWLGLIVAVLMNVDAIFLVKYLNADDAARARLAVTASQFYEDKTLMKVAQAQVDKENERNGIAPPKVAPDKETEKKAPLKAAPKVKEGASAADGAASDAEPSAGQAEPAKGPDKAASDTATSDVEKADKAAWAAVKKLTDLHLPIGWTKTRWDAMTGGETWALAILGWVLTAFALSFGAPFWFDLFNKMMVVRSTVKPTEKSPDEASEDAQGKKKT